MEPPTRPELSYTGFVSFKWEAPFKGWIATTELVKEAFYLRAQTKVFSDALDKILIGEPFELEMRNRARYSAILTGLSAFLEQIGFSVLVRNELIELALALDELDRGVVRHFLKPTFTPKKPELPSDKWAFRAQFSIAVELLCQQGMSRRKASKCISLVAEPLKIVVAPKSKNLASTIATWHKMFANGEVQDFRAQSMFQNGEELCLATVAYLRKQYGQEPTIDEVAAHIAYEAVLFAGHAQTLDEHTDSYEWLRKRPQKRFQVKSQR